MRDPSCSRLSHLGGQRRDTTVGRQVHRVLPVAEQSMLGSEFVDIGLGVHWYRLRRPQVTLAYGSVLVDAQRGQRHLAFVDSELSYSLQQLAARVPMSILVRIPETCCTRSVSSRYVIHRL